MRSSRTLTVLVVSGCLASGLAFAQEKKEEPKKAGEKAAAAAPDPAAMEAAWKAYMTPSEGHKKLEPLVGKWSAKTTSWMAPGAPPSESTGESEMRWILGGRYLEQTFKGTFMNEPFEGIGYTAFDNSTKKYVSTWMDSMGTGMMVLKGKMDASGKVMTSTGMFDDFMQKKPVKMKTTSTYKDADTVVFDMWSEGPDGKMFKSMEIVYTRKK